MQLCCMLIKLHFTEKKNKKQKHDVKIPLWLLVSHETSFKLFNLSYFVLIQGLDGRDGYGPPGPNGLKVQMRMLLC